MTCLARGLSDVRHIYPAVQRVLDSLPLGMVWGRGSFVFVLVGKEADEVLFLCHGFQFGCRVVEGVKVGSSPVLHATVRESVYAGTA